jgi:hypothetical protein
VVRRQPDLDAPLAAAGMRRQGMGGLRLIMKSGRNEKACLHRLGPDSSARGRVEKIPSASFYP